MRLVLRFPEQLPVLQSGHALAAVFSKGKASGVGLTISHKLRLPSSCPVTMNSSSPVHAARVAFEPVGLMVTRGSEEDSVGRVQSAPCGEGKKERGRKGRTSRRISVDLKHANGTLVPHSFLRHYQDLIKSHPSPTVSSFALDSEQRAARKKLTLVES